ncbi:DddA-like double-stranded DNA deaminase toxin [Lentzea sp. CA-135723]|uniref:DddA-like double-stranded DNA deaminase toxin n=1 Tax=Lentzea sp. CA-135723 TaxID=3239950 RepID=UPI003D90B929
MASIGEVVAAPRQVITDLPFTALAEALELAEDAKHWSSKLQTAAGKRSSHVITWFGQAAEGIGELQRRLTDIQRSVAATANKLEGLDQDGRVRGPVGSGRGPLRDQAVEGLRRLGLVSGRGTLTVADHVEVQIAVQLELSGEADTILAVNNRPCDVAHFPATAWCRGCFNPANALRPTGRAE